MDEIKIAIESIKPNPEIKYESFVIEQKGKSLRVEVKTIFEYTQEQYQKQKNRKQ